MRLTALSLALLLGRRAAAEETLGSPPEAWGKNAVPDTELTADTWDAAVAGKSVFVKFLAPW
jgi:hypothetical protein